MPKLDPEDQATASITTAPAPLPPGQTSAPATSTAFGSTASTGFGSSTTPASTGFGSAPTTGGFGGSSSFGGTSGGFGAPQQNFGGQQGQYQQTNTAAFSEAIAASADKEPEHWMKSYWRPAMGWLYMLTCFSDFVLFPVLWAIVQAMTNHQVTQQWNPITLQGAGLYHLAMGAILGIAAYGRTKEKTTGSN